MQHLVRMIACGALIALVTGCGGKESMASKSASAYEESLKKGVPVSAMEHSANHAESSTTSGGEHAQMAGIDHSTMPGMNQSAMANMIHSNTPGMTHGGMKETDHAAITGHTGMTGMDHLDMAGMQHGASTASVDIVTDAPRSSAVIARLQPGATLRTDTFDAPAPIAISEAAKAASEAHSMKPHGEKDHQ